MLQESQTEKYTKDSFFASERERERETQGSQQLVVKFFSQLETSDADRLPEKTIQRANTTVLPAFFLWTDDGGRVKKEQTKLVALV